MSDPALLERVTAEIVDTPGCGRIYWPGEPKEKRRYSGQVSDRRQVRPPPRTDVADPDDCVQVERRMLGLEVFDEAT